MKIKNKLLISTIFLAIISTVFTILVILVDKQAIGANNSIVGLSSLNKIFKDTFGYNEIFYKLTEILGSLILCIALGYMIVALIQLIKRKSIKKIDTELILLAIFYVSMILIYLIFEIAKINYRPVLIDGELEISYPSSHTLLSVFICTTAIFINQKLISKKSIKITFNCIISVIGLMTIIGRIISGVHWITDIIGGVLISTTLVLMYLTILHLIKNKNTDKSKQ